jgi:2-oxoisovalerate dehydrogenase E1 component
VVQNNGYAISVPQDKQTISEIHRIARGFGMPTFDLDGTWFEPMYQTIPPVIERIRAGHGPALVEAQVVRIDPHSSSDDQKKYRSQEELEELVERDPILQTEKYLLKNKIQTEEELTAIRAEISGIVNEAADQADQAGFPNPLEVQTHIWSQTPVVVEGTTPNYLSTEPVNMVSALNAGLHEEMARNPKIVMWGEDIADPKGGVFGVTRGLTTAYPDRVENSALAEASIVGVAGGMALNGYKPIVEIQFADYSWPAYMQIRNEIATVRWRSNDVWKCPVVIRIACGGYIKGGPWHSTCVEALYSHTPGWYVVYPSCAEDAKGLIKTAARSEDPVIFLEHKGLYRRVHAKTLEPDADYLIPFGRGKIRREGSDLTIVTWGSTVYLALDVAKELETEKISTEVIDLRSIVPIDEDLVYSSIRKTNRVVVAHEDALTMGFGAEVAARIAEHCFEDLDAPIIRLGAKDCFVPSAPNLEAAVLPSLEDMRTAVRKLLSY